MPEENFEIPPKFEFETYGYYGICWIAWSIISSTNSILKFNKMLLRFRWKSSDLRWVECINKCFFKLGCALLLSISRNEKWNIDSTIFFKFCRNHNCSWQIQN
ncbi:hypothetical protein BT63DRAFT_84120 [Microthyrium microscopicum]|uniref:Uncharacterized protein n=1 Tax=Microthyrium microscopicum TaxID=703497 RepID=A0A6A6TY90_9PEZI|nr:hypothetical protein BT63DRAFT_84120 [Microthyrium microscopicum]